jgi:hypothetical protein
MIANRASESTRRTPLTTRRAYGSGDCTAVGPGNRLKFYRGLVHFDLVIKQCSVESQSRFKTPSTILSSIASDLTERDQSGRPVHRIE